MEIPVAITVNGIKRSATVEPRLLLAHFLRDELGLTGTNIGCDTSQCGACTVLLDGKSVKSCTVLAVQADGSQVTTVEGLANNGSLHPIQQAFWEKHGLYWKADVIVVGQLASTAARLMSGVTQNLANAFFSCVKGKIEDGNGVLKAEDVAGDAAIPENTAQVEAGTLEEGKLGA